MRQNELPFPNAAAIAAPQPGEIPESSRHEGYYDAKQTGCSAQQVQQD